MRAQHRNGCVCSVCTAGDVSSGMELGLSFAAALFQGAIMPWAVQGVWAEGTPRGSGTPHKPHPPRCLLLLPPGSTDHGQGTSARDRLSPSPSLCVCPGQRHVSSSPVG